MAVCNHDSIHNFSIHNFHSIAGDVDFFRSGYHDHHMCAQSGGYLGAYSKSFILARAESEFNI
jgi:hypothetical protein